MLKNIIKWIVSALFFFMAFGSLFSGFILSAVLWLIVAFVISPLFAKLITKMGKNLSPKSYILGFAGLLFVTLICFSVEVSKEDSQSKTNSSVSQSNIALSMEEKEETPTSVIEKDVAVSVDEKNDIEKEALELKVHFIDVGQGDCTLIESKGECMLIDAGPDDVGTKIQKYLMDEGITKIDYFVLTHPDSDHIGSADVVATKFDIGKIYMSSFIKDNKYYHDMLDAFAYKNLKWAIPKEGDSFELGDAHVSIIHSKEYEDPNNSSLCIKVTCGETSFLFAGDAEAAAEEDMVNQNADLSATVYHVSHHGSYTSSTQTFLDHVKPEYAVISCAKDNVYGHPHQETLDKLKAQNIALFRTDLQGGIIAFTDGNEIEWSVAAVNDYKGGDSELEKQIKEQQLASLKAESQDNDNANGTSPSDKDKNGKSSDNADKIASGDNNNAGGNVDADNHKNNSVSSGAAYIGNKSKKKLHRADCKSYLPAENNREYFNSLEEATAAGYTKENQCQNCYPYGK